jgi:predicted metal-dependent phosphoesterase TrpH
MIDLHMHTVFSDGASQPEDLVQGALAHGLEAIAITDHDNVESFDRACAAAEGTPLTLIPGIEINTSWKSQEVHILGYYIDREHSDLCAIIEKHRESRIQQLKKMVELIRAKTRSSLTFDDVISRVREDGSVGRPHVAQALLEKGVVSSIGEAFGKYLSSNAPTYYRRETAPPHEAVEAIYESGGIPVIAHPGDMVIIEELVKDLMNYGLRGLEAYHRSHSPAVIEFHCSLAEKYDLIVTGGTDFHGAGDTYVNTLSRFFMPNTVYSGLKAEHKRLGMSAIKAS